MRKLCPYYKYKLLVEFFRLSEDYDAAYVAKMLGLTRSGLYKKLRHPNTFNLKDIEILLEFFKPYGVDFDQLREWMHFIDTSYGAKD